ncbi:anti-sigma factor family protein [Rhodococcus sp. NPDC003318]|uniref:anti-sigma factor family protein n=1 Tax=Rhodococcus sp. NPDC003318 TaxID=3364503 RepID=UPI0036C16726
MTTDRDTYERWDAAHVLGSLDADDRRAYERHLASCDTCAMAVAEVAGLPALLGRVPAHQALELDSAKDPSAVVVALRDGAVGDPPPDLLPRLIARTRPRRRWGRALGVAVVAALVVAAGVVVVSVLPIQPSGPSANAPQGPSAPVTAQAMEPVVPSPITADVSVIPQEWGTRIDVVCRYSAPPGGGYGTERSEFEMVLTDHTGATTRLATWSAAAGETVTPSATTSVPMLWIDRVDIRSVATDQVLLTSTF